MALSWKDPATYAKRSASIGVAVNTPSNRQRISSDNRKRWERPGERERLAEQNRTRWADDTYKTTTAAHIRDAWTPDVRADLSDKMKDIWQERRNPSLKTAK